MSDASLLVAWVGVWALIGSLIGSFANVVVYRWPRGLSVVRPRSACPHCRRTLGPLELLPVVSWLLQRGRCRGCGGAIAARYALVESTMAVAFAAIALAHPVDEALWTALPLLALFAMLLMAALIDLDTYLLPDALTLPAGAVAVLGAFLYAPGRGLPTPAEALLGALIAAGVLVLINRLGALALRRFRDTRERLAPISLDTVNVAAVVGVIGGLWVALAAGALQVLASALARRPLRLPEPALYGLWLLGLVAVGVGGLGAAWGVDLVAALRGSLAGAGAFAALGALWWWVAEWRSEDRRSPLEQAGAPPGAADDDEEPIAMGFGDVKLALPLGGMLGWEAFLVSLLLAVLLGAVVGVTQRLLGGSRYVPFGPFMVVGGFAALLVADPLITWYLGLLGV